VHLAITPGVSQGLTEKRAGHVTKFFPFRQPVVIMSIPAWNWAWRQWLSPNRKLVLLALADHHNGETGRCDPSIYRIKQKTGLKDRCIQGHLKGLAEQGLVTVQPRHSLTNRFILHFCNVISDGPRDIKPDVDVSASQVAVVETGAMTAAAPAPAEQVGTVSHDPAPHPANDDIPTPQDLRGNLNTSTGKEDSQSLRSARVEAPRAAEGEGARFQLWKEGTEILWRLTGRPHDAARRLLGQLLKHRRDDCADLLNMLRETEADRRIAPVDWLIAAAKHRGSVAFAWRQAFDRLNSDIDSYEAALTAGGIPPSPLACLPP
jgi:hypothetical protein